MEKIGRCKLCNKQSKNLESHHIIPKSRGGNDESNNLIRICAVCHGLAHDVSFTNERGGLVQEGINKYRENIKEGKLWLNENENLVIEKLSKLYDKDENKHNGLLWLLESGYITAYNLKEWVIDGKFTVKATIKFGSMVDELKKNDSHKRFKLETAQLSIF